MLKIKKMMSTVMTEPISIRVQKSKLKAFLAMLQLMEFVEIETLENKLSRYIKNAPKDVPLSDDDVMDIVKMVRNERKHG